VWSDALRAEEHVHGVHVGTVMPGFIPTEGFPQRELAEKRRTRWMLGTPEDAADAIAEVGLDRRAERYVPRFYGALAALRTVAPPLLNRALRSGRADVLATSARDS
jgi:short-subunit dehydrogenase